MNSDTSSEKLKALLGGLCRDAEDEKILEALSNAVKTFGEATIVFDGDWEVQYALGRPYPRPDDIPRSFHDISKIVSVLHWDGGGPEIGYSIADNGYPESDPWLFDDVKEDYPGVDAAGPVDSSFLAGQNGLFFDPTAQLANGEPAFAFIDHEDGEWVQVKSVQKLDYGQILLRMLCDAMIDTTHIPELSF